MTVRTWLPDNSYPVSMTAGWAWSPHGAPRPGDTLVMRHGYGIIAFTDRFWSDPIFLGSYTQGAPARLALIGAAAQVNLGYGPTDTTFPQKARYSEIDTYGHSRLDLVDYDLDIGHAHATVVVSPWSVLDFTASLSFATVTVGGGGMLRNAGTSLGFAAMTVDDRVIGTGDWQLNTASLTFLQPVGSGQTVHMGGFLTDLVLGDSRDFRGVVASTTGIAWDTGSVILKDFLAEDATYDASAQILHLTGGIGHTEDLRVALDQGFTVWQGPRDSTLIHPLSDHSSDGGHMLWKQPAA